MTGRAAEVRARVGEAVRRASRRLVAAETRIAAETGVCEALAAADRYVFAWFGTYDAAGDRVVPTASAGAGDGYLAEIEVAVDEEPLNQGPTARALRTGDVAVVQDAETDPEYGPWREQALAREFSSSAAVPVTSGDERYGVLNIYADRPAAFGETERELLVELAETTATAIARIESRADRDARHGRYERLTERISDAHYAVDDAWRITYWNDRMAERSGTDAETALGEVLWETFPEVLGTDVEQQYRAAMETGEHRSFEARLTEPREHWIEVDVYPDEEGLSVLSREVTERRRRQRELQRYERILENIPLAVVQSTLGDDAALTYLNDAAAELLGAGSAAELVGSDPGSIFADDENWAAFTAAVRDSGVVIGEEYDLSTVDGEHRFAEVTATTEEIDGEPLVIASIADVTERRRRERQLRRSRAFLERIQQTADIGGWELDFRTDELEWTEELYRIHGVTPEYELTVERAVEFYHPDDRSTVRAAIERLREEAREYDHELRIITADDEVRWVRATGEPVCEDGTVVGARGTFQDITGRKNRERDLQRQRDGLEFLNEMVRHDIRNDLQVVLLYAELLADEVDETHQDRVDTIVSKADAAISLTRTARDLAETILRSNHEPEPISLRTVLDQQLTDAQSAHETALIRTAGTLPEATVLAGEMVHSVFRNLLYNAVQHNDTGVPEVTVSAQETDETVTVRVADNGPGVPDAQKTEIFGRGERGRESDGTGIGLYLVDTLVDAYGGDVWVEDRTADADGIDGSGGAVFCVQFRRV